ncbi:hypothetical protein E7Z59_12725 [Robertkochia marina]|uniref:Lipocalin-like domain-containing protein n=1 Tax=Robertkochia marina TaxID=1227945 RepID=A0A4S3LZB7_9FLAO|nr:hypothetical protein [Robertkochia marina]THD66645.1 hypothetical protein E7Z59_12725 [Robertkochia marina]TRZ45517.1 hypothetical protein D3A96_05905 [Robertkochia marina]
MRYLLFALVIITFSSCTKDDDPGDVDPIIGTWQYIYRLDSNEEFFATPCQKKGRYVFYADGSLLMKGYRLNNEDVCIDAGTNSGSWKNLEFETYEIQINVDSGVIRISFPDNDKMRIYESETDYSEYQRL